MLTTLRRIEASDHTLHAFVTIDAQGALEAARAADRERQQRFKPLGPLHGLPVSVKDVIPTKGLRTTYGSRLQANNVPTEDAEAVARIRRAGGIVIGKTTTSEFAHKALTDSPLTGYTRNPWSPTHGSGGSSGGAAVSAAMNFTTFNLSTDGGGSSRIPASCCGIVGLKPTMGSIPNERSQDLFGLQVIGMMSRDTTDLRTFFDTVRGPYTGDPMSLRSPEPSLSTLKADAAALEGLRVAWVPLIGNRLVSHEVSDATAAALRLLEDAGALIHEASYIDWRLEDCQILMRAQQAQRFRSLEPKDRSLLDTSLLRCIAEGEEQGIAQLQAAILNRSALYRDIQSIFRTADVIASPVLATPSLVAEHQAHDVLEIDGEAVGDVRQGWHSYTIPFNASGHPAISIPCPVQSGRLPVGLQIVGPWFSEPLLLDIAKALECLAPWSDRWPSS